MKEIADSQEKKIEKRRFIKDNGIYPIHEKIAPLLKTSY